MEKKVYYALKYTGENSYRGYWSRKGSPTPALFTSENMAVSTLTRHAPAYVDKYKVVKFMEVE